MPVTPRRQPQLIRSRAAPIARRLHLPHLVDRERPKLTRLHALDADARVLRPVEPNHRVPNRRAQSLHQVRPAFGHDDLEPGILLSPLEPRHLGRRGEPIFQPNAAAQLLERRIVGVALHLGQIHPRHLVLGVHQLVRGLAVIGEQQRALGVIIEPPHGEDPAFEPLDILADRRPALRVMHRGDDPGRLVKQVPLPLIRGDDGGTVHHDQVFVAVDLGAQGGDDLTVDLHATVENQLLGGATRRDARAGEVLLKTLHGLLLSLVLQRRVLARRRRQ